MSENLKIPQKKDTFDVNLLSTRKAIYPILSKMPYISPKYKNPEWEEYPTIIWTDDSCFKMDSSGPKSRVEEEAAVSISASKSRAT